MRTFMGLSHITYLSLSENDNKKNRLVDLNKVFVSSHVYQGVQHFPRLAFTTAYRSTTFD